MFDYIFDYIFYICLIILCDIFIIDRFPFSEIILFINMRITRNLLIMEIMSFETFNGDREISNDRN